MFTDHEIDTIQMSLDYMSAFLACGCTFDGQELDWDEAEFLRDSLEDPDAINDFDISDVDAVLVALELLIDLMHQDADLDKNVLTVTEIQALKVKVATLQ